MLAETAGMNDATFVVVGLGLILGSGVLMAGLPYLLAWAIERIGFWLSGSATAPPGSLAKATSIVFRCLCLLGLVTGLWLAVEYSLPVR